MPVSTNGPPCAHGQHLVVMMVRKQQDNAPAPAAQPAYKVVKREKDRLWEVRDPQDELVCVTVYKRGDRGGPEARGVRNRIGGPGRVNQRVSGLQRHPLTGHLELRLAVGA